MDRLARNIARLTLAVWFVFFSFGILHAKEGLEITKIGKSGFFPEVSRRKRDRFSPGFSRRKKERIKTSMKRQERER